MKRRLNIGNLYQEGGPRYGPYYRLSLIISVIFRPLNLSSYYKENFAPLFRLINRAFTKSSKLTFLSFWFPFIFILIVADISSAQYTIFAVGIMIPTIVGIQVLPSLLVEFKQSSLLKKIGATRIKTWMLTMTFIAYFSLVSFISIVFNVGVGIAIYFRSMHFNSFSFNGMHFARVVNFGQYTFAIILSLFISISVGMGIAGIVRTASAALLCSLIIILIGGFLSGQFMSFKILNRTPALKYIGFLFPQKWPTLLGVIATSGGNIFDLSAANVGHVIDWENIGTISSMAKEWKIPFPVLLKKYPIWSGIAMKDIIILAYIMPLIISALAFLVSIKWFKWK